jgi:hypothetical protein
VITEAVHGLTASARSTARRTARRARVGVLDVVRRELGRRRYVVQYSPYASPTDLDEFQRRAKAINARHAEQTPEDVRRLQARYADPIIGEDEPVRLVEMLGQVVDPANPYLGCTSQLTHVLQVLDAMEADGANEEMRFFALVHDLGKLALLRGELPEHVEGNGRRVIGEHEPGAGLDHCTLQFAHGEIVHQRLGHLVPDHLAWLLRYHDMVLPACRPYFDERDREYCDRWYLPFMRYDRTFSAFHLPRARLAEQAKLLETYLPPTIDF